MVDTQHFCLRWNNYQSSITSAFENLRDDEDFVDVTLACDGKSLKAHRVVLSACSPYFRELLKSTPCKHPVIVLQDVAFTDLHALVEFIYHGEVNVHQRSLSSFLKTAEVLRVSGLTQHDDAQGPLVQSLARAAAAAQAAASPHTPAHPAHTPHPPHTPSYTEKLEEALSQPPPLPMMRRAPLPPRRISRSADNSPDVIKRARHDNNNTEQSQVHDFSTKNHNLINNTRAHADSGNGNGISNSSGSPSPSRLMNEVKDEPLDMICGSNADIDRSIDDTPPHHHRTHGGGPPSRGSSADAEDRTPPPQLPPSPFLQPGDTKLFAANQYPFPLGLSDHHSMSGLPSPISTDMAGTSQGGARTPQEDYRCEPCNKSLSSLTRLKRHIQNVHMRPSREPVCNICRRVYSSLNSLRNHKSIYHRKQQPPAAGAGPFYPVN
ncbi:broad-complex core protein isoforms 1/2/3/4/5 isoform X6 [Plutella xylostella]|uniref:broad-complex core protein isoforms 1/2/3/4/5 isoform X6 n=1 Tax=Plutella xylostella TaxID=51655 RepID=UPI002032BEE2|nr:broad-complex core protein isoforms 1/2/3/4/5 isoform X6 [Plutella xylostella]